MTGTTDSPGAVRLRLGGIQLAVLGRSEASALFIVVIALAAVTIVGLHGGADSPLPSPSSRLVVMDDLTPASVGRLTEAWVAHTGEYAGGMGPNPPQSVEGFQTRPALVGGLLIVTTTTSKVIAIDAETGKEAWRFDPFAGKGHVCDFPHRGVGVWSASTSEATVFSGTCDGHLVALDARTGQPRSAFGTGGVVDLRTGLGVPAGEEYGVTSAPAIYRDLVIVGSRLPEDKSRGPSGDVRAFDVHSGQERWRFHTVPQPGEAGHDTWAADAWQGRTGVNVWSTMAVDDERGLLFMPIGSASYDFYGADRPGPSLYANCLVALDAATGRLKWYFQLVHHDLWDYDPPAQPILADITSNGRRIPAVIQLTKMGLVFVFDRVTGTPVYGVEERPVPQSEVPGERSSATQPFPIKPAPLGRTTPITRADLSTIDETARTECGRLFDQVATSGGIYTPEGRSLTLWFPGTLGGATWSGGTVDTTRNLLIVNSNEVGAVGQMEAQPPGAVEAFKRTSAMGAYARFWDSRHLPCQQPPWGRLTAVDLGDGSVRWQVPFGVARAAGAAGATTGTPNLGGAVSTTGGVVFIGATNDAMMRAFDTASGRVLWESPLPASGHATPTIYRGPKSGRPFVVIAAGGGGRFSSTVSDSIVAFTLPKP